VELHVLEDGVGVLVLGHTLVQLVGLSVIAGLSEASDIGNSSERGTSEEPEEGACGVLGQRCGIEEGACGCAVHENHSEEAPEGSAVEIAETIAVRGNSSDVSSLVVLIELERNALSEGNYSYLCGLPDVLIGIEFLCEFVELNKLVDIATHAIELIIKSFHFIY